MWYLDNSTISIPMYMSQRKGQPATKLLYFMHIYNS